MKSFFKKLAFVMALAMVVSLAAPAAQSALAATEFTYAEQESGKKVTSLSMKAGDKVDLKFIGVKDYKNFILEWQSSNPSVATVDKNGVITAISEGVTEVTLKVGDGTVYTSTPVRVGVGEVMDVVLGTSKNDTFSEYTLNLGETVDLNFYGVTNWTAGKYACTWTSTNTAVATVDKMGVVTPVAAGTTEVTVAIVDKATGVALNVVPVSITVPESTANLSYTVAQVSDITANLTFEGEISLKASDISLSRVYDGDIEVAWPIEEVKMNGNVVTIKPYVAFADGDKYIVRVGSADEGHPFTTSIGAVDQIAVSYKSLDKTGKAYTNGEDGDEITITLSARLYSKGVDVTNVYGTDDIVYTLLTDNDNISIDEYSGTVVFYREKVAATVVATYTYMDAEDNEKTVKTPVVMISELAPKYAVTGVKAWTIVKEGQESKIDWNKTVHSIAAYDDSAAEYHIVALITDNYGYTYVTDARAKKENDKIYAMDGTNDNEDANKFYNEGYFVEFSSANVEKMLVDSTGYLATYTAASVPVILSLHNEESERENYFVRNISALPVTVQAARTINRVTVDNNSLQLVTNGDYTTGSAKVKVYDQYGEPWGADVVLDVTASIEAVQDANVCTEVEYLANNKEGVITLDGKTIKVVSGSKNSLSFTIKEKSSGKSTTLKVALKNPKQDEEGNVVVTSSSVAAENVDQMIKKEADGTTKFASVNFYEMSNSYKVGLDSNITLVTTSSALDVQKPAEGTEGPKKGDKYLVIYNPDNKIVGASASGSALGVVNNEDGSFNVVVAAADENGVMQYAPTGTYTVKVLEIKDFNNRGMATWKTRQTVKFTVTNTSNDVEFKKQNAISTSQADIANIVKDTLSFTLGGKDWNYRVEDIEKVDYRYKGDYVIILSVTFKVPLNGSDDNVGYLKKVSVNKPVNLLNGFTSDQSVE